MTKKRVIVSGLGIISPLGNSLEDFTKNIKKGLSGIDFLKEEINGKKIYGAKIKNFDFSKYLTRKDSKRMDFASQISVAAAWESIKSSKINLENEDPFSCGVCLGTTAGGTVSGEKYFYNLKKRNKSYASFLLDYPLYSAGTHLSIIFNFQGINLVLSTACSSSNIALGYAYDQIKRGKAKIMLSGGFDVLNSLTLAGFNVLRNTSSSGLCRPFDKNRDGLILGEGAAVLVLEEIEHCLKRKGPILAEILGYGISSDAYHMTSPDLTGKGAVSSMEKAIKNAQILKEKISYINAHGTGTIYNDLMETRAVKKYFGDFSYKIPISSTKSMLGHTLGASGAIEAVTSILAIEKQFLPPTINYQTPDPQCDLDYVPNNSREAKINYVLSNNFGFGGINCSIVFAKPQIIAAENNK